MCGFCGVLWHAAPPDHARALVHRMNQGLAHRGPDDGGLWEGARATLGHRRLSVIDTSSASHQPMVTDDGRIAMVYNGEIYNYLELRRELEGRGRRFRTEGDSEVLLQGFAEWGPGIFSRANGMFAAAFFDTASEELTLVRDRLGIKPLYYAEGPLHFAFASEIRPLAASGLAGTALNCGALADYFQFLYTPGRETLFEGIRSLSPGCHLTRRKGTSTVTPYWTLTYDTNTAWTLDSAAERLDDLLADSVRLRERSDVPLGAFLSGGLDSSSVVAALCRQRTAPLKTFSIGFDEPEANELAYARAVADYYQTDHTEAVLRPDLASLLPELVNHFGEPFADSSALPMWLVSRLAREQVTVALSGDGGDELFAGYGWTHMNVRVGQYRRLPETLRRAGGLALRLLPDSPRWNRVRRFQSDSFLDSRESFQRRLSCFTPAQLAELLQPDILRGAGGGSNPVEALWSDGAARNDADRMLYTDTRMYLPGDILTKVDRMSMAHALEARVPLLDYRIVEFAATLPFSLKYRGGISKRVLKHLMRDRLPAAALAQRKRGFSLPIHRWMRTELAELFCDTVLAPGARCGEYLQLDFVQKLWRSHAASREDHGHRLWALLIFEIWLRNRA